jgi:Uma2 family endonuclease
MSAQFEPRRFNVTEYYRMAEAGVLKPDDRVELIEGEIIKMSPIGGPHAACVERLDDLLAGVVEPSLMVRMQNPITLDDFSEPIPDIAIVRARRDYYATRHPAPAEVFLIIEVADTTVLTDRNIKIPLYARIGIPESWLINLPKQMIEVYFDLYEGKYRKRSTFKRGESVNSATIKGLLLSVDEILG